MRVLFLIGVLLGMPLYGDFFIQGNIDASSTNITTAAYLQCYSSTRRIRRVVVNNTSGVVVRICFNSLSSNCDATDFRLGDGQGFAFDVFPLPNRMFIKSDSGTATTGHFSCIAWEAN